MHQRPLKKMTSTSNRSDIKIAVFSDIHLGHRRNPTVEILRNLYVALPDSPETAELDALFFAGDVFDDLLSLTDADLFEIDMWIAYVLRLCKKYNIVCRVLKGTPSHDWDQSQRFEAINEVAEIGADLKYVKTLSVEYIEQIGKTVLYVPDEWEITTDKTLSQVRELLRAKGLDKVDIGIMHGQFDYQVPEMLRARIPVHDSKAYLSLVSGVIAIGHVHRFSQYKWIVAQGSTDRLTHGEEEPKGHVRITLRRDGTRDIKFVETVGAKKFVTVTCVGMDIDQTLNEIGRVAGDLPAGSFVRVEADDTNPIFTNMDVLIRHFPLFTFSKLARDTGEDSEVQVEEIVDETLFVPITITDENIHPLLMARLSADPNLPEAVHSRASYLLKELVDGN